MLCTWMFGISNYSTESTNLRVLNCRIPGERLILFTENANYFQILQGWVVIASPLVSWSLCNFRNICLIDGNFFFFQWIVGVSRLRVCSSDKMTPIYFLRLSNVWSVLHHGAVGRVHKKMLLYAFIYIFGIFLFFNIKFVFLTFSFLFLMKYQISATKYKRELVVSKFQWNYMLLKKFHSTCYWFIMRLGHRL